MSMRYRVKGTPLINYNHTEDTAGEPFAVIRDNTGGHIVLTREQYFDETDEPQSSAHERNQQLERERG